MVDYKRNYENLLLDLEEYSGWFNESRLKGIVGIDSPLYLAMKRDFKAILKIVGFEPEQTIERN